MTKSKLTNLEGLDVILEAFDEWAESLSLDKADIIFMCAIKAAQNCVTESRVLSRNNLFHAIDVLKRFLAVVEEEEDSPGFAPCFDSLINDIIERHAE